MNGLEGFDEALRTLDAMARASTDKMHLVLEYILRQMCNYAKQNGPWEDHTANLRNSIGINFELMTARKAEPEKIQELADMQNQLKTPVLQHQGDKVWGYLYAGMEYAIYVERLDGYWVLEGAINFFEPKINQIMKDRLRIQRADLG